MPRDAGRFVRLDQAMGPGSGQTDSPRSTSGGLFTREAAVSCFVSAEPWIGPSTGAVPMAEPLAGPRVVPDTKTRTSRSSCCKLVL